MPKMSIVFHSGAPPLAPFLLQRRRKRYEISVLYRGCSSFSFPQGVKGESLAHDIFAAKLKVS